MKTSLNHSRRLALLVYGAAVVLLVGTGTGPVISAGQVAPAPVTFTKDIAPILQRSCQNCHRPQGVAPMSLTTYQQVRPWARAIKLKTASREMPPWFIEKNVGIQKFKDDPSLSDREIAMIASWADTGAPEGNPADMPPPRQFPAGGGWSFGTPDLIVSSPTVTVKAVAPDWHGDVGHTVSGLTEDRYIKSVEVREFRPDEQLTGRAVGQASGGGDLNYFVVHHAVVTSKPADEVDDSDQRSSEERSADQATPAQRANTQRASLPVGEFSYIFEVGQNAMIYPDDVGILLPANSTVYFPNVHLHSIGKDVKVQMQVGFTFHPKGYKPKYPRGVSSLPIRLTEIDIRGGQDNARHDAFTTLRRPAKGVTFEPHLHASGKRMCVEAILPNGFRETLNCAGYNHNWVKAYVYEDDAAPLLPAGTIIHVTGWYDNTAKNPRNVDPRNWHGVGQRSVDDMFLLFSKFLFLTEEEFKAEVEAREAKERTSAAGTRTN